jgi:hypothetical protein
MSLSPPELGEVRDELHGGIALPNCEQLDASEKRVVRQLGGGGEDIFVHDRV